MSEDQGYEQMEALQVRKKEEAVAPVLPRKASAPVPWAVQAFPRTAARWGGTRAASGRWGR